jgi:hypothetical protein
MPENDDPSDIIEKMLRAVSGPEYFAKIHSDTRDGSLGGNCLQKSYSSIRGTGCFHGNGIICQGT